MTAEDQGKRLLTAPRKWSWLCRLTVWLFALGAVINLLGKSGPTVLGTDNVMMAAVLAEGITVIEGAICKAKGERFF